MGSLSSDGLVRAGGQEREKGKERENEIGRERRGREIRFVGSFPINAGLQLKFYRSSKVLLTQKAFSTSQQPLSPILNPPSVFHSAAVCARLALLVSH